MSGRSANASIKGYNYQFLHTIKDILEQSDNDVCVIEGIEDFDIEKDGEKDLIQYKFHEMKTFTNSRVAKPIALMFKHFQANQQESNNYKLFIYLTSSELPEITLSIITEVLKIKEARTILSDTDVDLTNENIDSLSNDIGLFIEKLSWKLTKKYEDLEKEIIEDFKNNLGITSEESEIIYLSNAIKIVNDLAIKRNEEERKITKRTFISKLNSYKKKE